MIRILHVIGTMNQGGAETLIMELYRHIDRTKIQFDFLIYNYGDEPGFYDDEIRRLGGRIFQAKAKLYKEPLKFLQELDAFFKTHSEYLIVHSHQYTTSGFILTVARRHNKITIAHAHAIKKKRKLSIRGISEDIACRLMRKNADYFFGCSEEALKSLSGKNSDDIRFFIMKNAIDVEKFVFSKTSREYYRKELSVDDNLVIGCVGRFYPVKNHKFLLDVFSVVSSINNKAKLVLVGNGPELENVKRYAREIGVIEQVIFTGARSDINLLLNAFDAFCLPSRSEGLGIVYIEAQCNGLQCVAPKDVVPKEADVGGGLMTRISLTDSVTIWAEAVLDASLQVRHSANEMKKIMLDSGYDIKIVSKWLENFYLTHM